METHDHLSPEGPQQPPSGPAQYSREYLFLGRNGGSRAATLLATHNVGPIACDCWKIAYVTAGSAALIVNEVFTHHVRGGDLLVLRRGAVYSLRPVIPTAATIVYVDAVFLRSRLAWLLQQPENQVAIRAAFGGSEPAWVFRAGPEWAERVGEVFSAISHAPLNSTGASEASMRDLARLLDVLDTLRVIVMNEEPPVQRPGIVPMNSWPTGRPEVVRAARLMNDELAGRWTLDGLASAVNLSPSRLSAVFRSETGSSPISYLAELRLQRFAYLLIATNLSVSEAASRAGWRQADYATRVFRRRFGVSPRQYRKGMATVTDDSGGGTADGETRTI